MYFNVNESNGVEKRYLISHHKFHESIALACIKNTNYRYKCTTSIATISTRTSSKLQSSYVSTASSIIMGSSLEREINMLSRVCVQVILTGGMIAIIIYSSCDNLPQIPTTYKPRCTLHWWFFVELRASVLFFPSCNINCCLCCYICFHQNLNIVQTKKTIYNQFSHSKGKYIYANYFFLLIWTHWFIFLCVPCTSREFLFSYWLFILIKTD